MSSIALPGLLAAATLLWLMIVIGFCVISIVATRRLAQRTRDAARTPVVLPPIDILRPCEGTDPGLEENLLSTVTCAYPAARRVFIAVPSRRDPSAAIADRVKARAAELAPDVPVEVVVTGIESEGNRKAAQLAKVYPFTTATVLVQADSDVRLDDRSLPALVPALLADDQAGLSYAPAVEVMPQTLGDRLSAALLSSSPMALVSIAALREMAGGPQLVAGALMAHRREALDAIGGFAALEPYLGEDFELARRHFLQGRTARVAAVPALCTDGGLSVLQVVRRYARWALVVRRQRPSLMLSYFLFFSCFLPLTVMTLVTALVKDPYYLACAAGLTLLVLLRGVLALTARRAYELPGGYGTALVAALGGELVLFFSSCLAMGPSTVEWRGRRFHIGARGAMEALPDRTGT